jgi:hypothetical protein
VVHKPELERKKVAAMGEDLRAALAGLPPEQQEAGVRHFLSLAALTPNLSRLQLLLSLLEGLVTQSVLPAR